MENRQIYCDLAVFVLRSVSAFSTVQWVIQDEID